MLTLTLALTLLGAAPTPNATVPDDKAATATSAPAEKAQCGHAMPSDAEKTAKIDGVLVRGAAITGKASVAVKDLVAAPDKHAGKALVVEGTVRKVCEKAGCWMELAESDKADAAGMRVTFKDHGFFVPTSSAGAKAKIEGTVQVAQLTDEQVKHLEGEGAKLSRGSDGKAREVRFVASGVELRR